MERDELTAAVATMNLRHWPEAVVRCEDATTTDLAGFGGAFVDPARRRRPSPASAFDPRAVLAAAVVRRSAWPAAARRRDEDGPRHPAPARARRAPRRSGCPSAGTWWRRRCGSALAARDGVRRAALVLPPDGDESSAARRGHRRRPGRPGSAPVGGVLYEPDGAVIRAGLVGQVAAAVERPAGRPGDRLRHRRTGSSAPRSPPRYAVEDVFAVPAEGPAGVAARPGRRRSRSRSAGPRWSRSSCAASCGSTGTPRRRSCSPAWRAGSRCSSSGPSAESRPSACRARAGRSGRRPRPARRRRAPRPCRAGRRLRSNGLGRGSSHHGSAPRPCTP